MTDKSLTLVIREMLKSKEIDLPVFNLTALKLQRIIGRDDYSAAEIEKTIQLDQGLSATLLKVSNSAFFAGLHPVKTVREAAVRLGARQVTNIAMLVTQKKMYQTRVLQFKAWMEPLWRHALGTAVAAKWLGQTMGYSHLVEEVFMAGLLHDIGKLLLIRIIDEIVARKITSQSISVNLVEEILIDLHGEYGRQYLHDLNMPETYSLVAARHHDPHITGENISLNIVRLANLTCHKMGIGLTRNPDLILSTTPEAINLMAKDLVLAELQVQLEDSMSSVDKAI